MNVRDNIEQQKLLNKKKTQHNEYKRQYRRTKASPEKLQNLINI